MPHYFFFKNKIDKTKIFFKTHITEKAKLYATQKAYIPVIKDGINQSDNHEFTSEPTSDLCHVRFFLNR